MNSYLLIELVLISTSPLQTPFASSANAGSTCNRLYWYLDGLISMLAIMKESVAGGSVLTTSDNRCWMSWEVQHAHRHPNGRQDWSGPGFRVVHTEILQRYRR